MQGLDHSGPRTCRNSSTDELGGGMGALKQRWADDVGNLDTGDWHTYVPPRVTGIGVGTVTPMRASAMLGGRFLRLTGHAIL